MTLTIYGKAEGALDRNLRIRFKEAKKVVLNVDSYLMNIIVN